MCGIAGIIKKKGPASLEVREFLDVCRRSMHHRGPDDWGICAREESGFINLRLAIVDIAGGRQPIFSDDGRVGIVYNGEVYNYRELREDLKARGYTFKTNTDTEVILHAYEAFGEDSFNRLNGMFCFCIWDDRQDIVYLVRDPIGIKPLYLYEDDTCFSFSSELKALIGIQGLDLSLDPAGFQDYLMFRYVQAPFTFFKKIRRLDAGTYLKIKKGVAAQYRYWDISYNDPYPWPDIMETKETLLGKLKKAVLSQLMGEVPIGILLSGGIDSSAIAYLVHTSGADLMTFNIGFPTVNEFEYSDAVASRYGLRHVKISISEEELLDSFEEVMLAVDEPIADPACLPLFRLCEELKQYVTVVLSGEGGDELFAGYPQYAHIASSDPGYNRRFVAFMERSRYFQDYPSFLKDPRQPPHVLRHQKYFEEQPLLNGMLAYDMKTWVPENLMMKADKIMMAHSLEGRFPFLDKELFEFVSLLPQPFKLSPDGTTKWLLKDLAEPYLPKSVVKRPKMGFTVPVSQLLSVMKPRVLEAVDGAKHSEISEILNSDYINSVVHSFYKGARISPLQIWTLFILCCWFSYSFPRYKNGDYALPGRSCK
jgi:asparagine synthase (glutamine-hydrolysing)